MQHVDDPVWPSVRIVGVAEHATHERALDNFIFCSLPFPSLAVSLSASLPFWPPFALLPYLGFGNTNELEWDSVPSLLSPRPY